MKCLRAALTLFILLMAGMPSVLTATGLSLPSIPDFRLPSGGSVNTTFPAATGGVPPYRYSASGLPPGITFDASTRGASGTLPTVTADTSFRIVYTARDSSGTIVDGSVGTTVRFTTTVTAPRSRIRLDPAPPGTIRPADPSDVPVVSVRRVHTLPFTASESGSGEKSYSFRLEAGTEVSVSLTGMNRDIDCRVNGSACTNCGGTQDDSWSGTLSAGTHTVTVYPYGGGSGNWTLSVSGRTSSPPPTGPTSTPSPPTTDSGQIVKTGVNVSSSRTYPFTLSHRADVSVELTGMTTDFDCTVSGNRCTNRGGTRDDSWTGTLEAGEHKIVVYPYGGGSGNYTLTISAAAPTTGGSTGTRTQVTTLVDTSETNISTSRTYNFTLARRARVDVALTGLTIDFDCRVGSSRCTNRWGTRDDSWSDDLGEGNHSVVVYPYDPGPGNYSLTVMATETVHFVATPLAGGPIRLRVCEKDRGGENTDIVVPGSCVEVVIPGGEGNPDDGGDGDGGPTGGPVTPQEPTDEQKESRARADATARAQRYNCRVFFRQNGVLNIVDELGRVSFDRTDPVNACTADDDAAYSDHERWPRKIFTCPYFYDVSDSLRADTVLHEMLHLAGKSHDDLGGPGPFHQKVMEKCP